VNTEDKEQNTANAGMMGTTGTATPTDRGSVKGARVPAQKPAMDDDEINLVDLILTIWQGKWWIVLFGVLGTLGGVVFALLQPNIYESKVVYVVQDDQPNISLGGAAALLGGFGGGSGVSGKYEVILQSTDLYIEIITKHNLLKELFAGMVDTATGEWLADLEKKPTVLQGVEVLRGMVSYTLGAKDAKTLTMSVQHQDSVQAYEWLGFYTEAFLQKIETMEKESSQEALDFYAQKIHSTESPDVRASLAKLIAEETKKALMIGKARFQVVDEPRVPEKRVKPKRSLIVIVAMLASGFMGVFWVFALGFGREVWREMRGRG
jgi:uncharacterized protein involved in exopolysaccharide biosynthesis